MRHGHLPERTVQTGIGSVEVQQPRVRDRGNDGEKIRFSPAILRPYARRSKSLDVLIPILYLRGISSGDFQEALSALLGKDAPNLSPAVLSRLKAAWKEEFERWQQRDLLSPALRLHLGRRRVPAGQDGSGEAIHSRFDRRHA